MSASTIIEREIVNTWPDYHYENVLAASEQVNWRVEDLIGGAKRLDFRRPFMPETLARVEMLDFLTPQERLTLNQIRGHDYLYIFGLVEEFILPFVLDHARPILHGNNARVRAFLNFAGEEAKHIELFKRFREDFLNSFFNSSQSTNSQQQEPQGNAAPIATQKAPEADDAQKKAEDEVAALLGEKKDEDKDGTTDTGIMLAKKDGSKLQQWTIYEQKPTM